MRVAEECEGKSRLSVFFLHERLRVFALWCSTCKKANSTQAENNPSHDGVTFLWNRPSGLQGHEGSLFKCTRSLPAIATDTEDPTDGRKSLLATLYSCQKNCMVAFLKILAGYLHLTAGSFCLINALYLRKKTSKVHTLTLLLSFGKSLFLPSSGNHNMAAWLGGHVLRNTRLTDDF